MSQAAADRRVRSVAKSCVECRRRKIRCVWSSNRGEPSGRAHTSCDYCTARGRTCLPQMQRPQASSASRTTARDRINQLEQEMATLSALVRDKHVPASKSRDLDTNEETEPEGLVDETDWEDFDDTSPPLHLRLLFNNFALDSPEGESPNKRQKSMGSWRGPIQRARARLQKLIPSRREVSLIAEHALPWMTLYHTLFPTFTIYRTGDQLIANYDQMHDEDVYPVTLAMYLLVVAVTAQQTPPTDMPASFNNGRGVPNFVNAVCHTIEHTILAINVLAGTPEGLETAMLCVRLSLGRGNLKSTWLALRKIIALAELIGLPQANEDPLPGGQTQVSDSITLSEQKDSTMRAGVWEAICATDRNFGMMLSLPAGTLRYRFPRAESIWENGQVSPQAYNYQLSDICSTIFDIDNSYQRLLPPAESYEKVLNADRRLRALATSASRTWWQREDDASLADLLVKFWHSYITLRVHLRPGMLNNIDDQYSYSYMACREACEGVLRRFPRLRPLVPSGFFVCRVLDVQVFTAATFVLLSGRHSSQQQSPDKPVIEPSTEKLVQEVVNCLSSVSSRPGGDLAREATHALTSLLEVVQENEPSEPKSLTVQIPLLGQIHVNVPGSKSASSSKLANTPMVPDGSDPIEHPDIDVSLGQSSSALTGMDLDVPALATSMPWSFELDEFSLHGAFLLSDDLAGINGW